MRPARIPHAKRPHICENGSEVPNMNDSPFRTIEIIANPTAHNGRAAEAASWLRAHAVPAGRLNSTPARITLVETAHAGDACRIARTTSADVVVGLGGDGIAHEIAQGLMVRPRGERPVFGLLPFGNGNDYARTIGMPANDVAAAWRALDAAIVRPLDVGECNGTFVLQTASFGLDAAIALGTQDRRARTGITGTRLYLEEGFDQLAHHLVTRHATIALDDGAPFDFPLILGAVQIGRTYGGGFDICPAADAADGIFDICLAAGPVSAAQALFVFLRAKHGRHLGNRHITSMRARRVEIAFDQAPPCQVDGERLEGTRFTLAMHPRELDVLCGREQCASR